MQITSQIAIVLLDVCRAWTNKTRKIGSSCEECDARRLDRLQDEHDTSATTRVVPVVDRSNSSFYIAFGAVEVFLVWACLDCTSTWYRLKTFFWATYYANNVCRAWTNKTWETVFSNGLLSGIISKLTSFANSSPRRPGSKSFFCATYVWCKESPNCDRVNKCELS